MNNKLTKAVGVLQLLAGLLAALALVQNLVRGGQSKMLVISAVVMVSGLYLGYENIQNKK